MRWGEAGVGGNQEAERPQEAAPELLPPCPANLTLHPPRQAARPTASRTARTHSYLHSLALCLPPPLLHTLYPPQGPSLSCSLSIGVPRALSDSLSQPLHPLSVRHTAGARHTAAVGTAQPLRPRSSQSSGEMETRWQTGGHLTFHGTEGPCDWRLREGGPYLFCFIQDAPQRGLPSIAVEKIHAEGEARREGPSGDPPHRSWKKGLRLEGGAPDAGRGPRGREVAGVQISTDEPESPQDLQACGPVTWGGLVRIMTCRGASLPLPLLRG